jgi:hypothetical protein
MRHLFIMNNRAKMIQKVYRRNRIRRMIASLPMYQQFQLRLMVFKMVVEVRIKKSGGQHVPSNESLWLNKSERKSN